jgi:hypothetical protein
VHNLANEAEQPWGRFAPAKQLCCSIGSHRGSWLFTKAAASIGDAAGGRSRPARIMIQSLTMIGDA